MSRLLMTPTPDMNWSRAEVARLADLIETAGMESCEASREACVDMLRAYQRTLPPDTDPVVTH